MKIKIYELRIVIDEDQDELLHVSERYDCEESEDIIKLEVKGTPIRISKDLQKSIGKLDGNVLGIA
jgi:hypothetical protein